MNLKYVKSEIYNLGFSTEEDVEPSVVIQAINRAVDTISNTVRPILGNLTIQIPQLGIAYIGLYDLKEMAEEEGHTFLGVDHILELTEEGFVPARNCSVISRRLFQVAPVTQNKAYLVWYKRMYTPVTESTPDSFEFELDADLHVLIPLLAAFYVWQDDEERKADKLYNDYETKRNDIVARETKTVAYVRGDV